MYAKDKTRRQVEGKNTSTVNLLKDVIPDEKVVFDNTNVGKFDYSILKTDSNYELNEDDYTIIDIYTKLDRHKYFFIKYEDDKVHNLAFVYQDIRETLLSQGVKIDKVVDILVEYLYGHKESDYKMTLWEVFGTELVENLQKNIDKPLDNGWVMCDKCGERVENTNGKVKYCKKCRVKIEKSRKR